MRKEITLKLLKNPENFIYKEDVLGYIMALEEEGRLCELPKNLYVYYVISLFADEVNNGGVEAYLENSSGKTLCDLSVCAEHLSHGVITPFLLELCEYISAGGKAFESFEKRFYDIEQKHDFRKAALKYYKENFEVEKIKIPAVKEKESDTCAYFTVTEKEKCADIEEGLKAFLEVLAGFTELRFRVFIYTYINGDYAVYARSLDGNINLRELMTDWGKNEKLKAARLKMCDYFGEATVESLDGGKKYGISITKSGFEKDEYKMKLKFIAAGYDTMNTKGFSRVTLKRFAWGAPEFYEKIKKALETNCKNYPNIDGVAEEGFTL